MNIHLHLTDILMLKFTDFQIKQYKAAQQPIIKNQINHEVFFKNS